MNRTMDMTVATPEGIVFEGKVESVKFLGASGAFMVLPRHAPLISALTQGKMVYTQEGKTLEIAIQSGFVEIRKDVISVCVEV